MPSQWLSISSIDFLPRSSMVAHHIPRYIRKILITMVYGYSVVYATPFASKLHVQSWISKHLVAYSWGIAPLIKVISALIWPAGTSLSPAMLYLMNAAFHFIPSLWTALRHLGLKHLLFLLFPYSFLTLYMVLRLAFLPHPCLPLDQVEGSPSSSPSCAPPPSHAEATSPQPAPTRSHPMVTRLQDGTRRPKVFLSTCHPIPSCFLANSMDNVEPTSSSQAPKDPKWRAAMMEEFSALIRNGTWSLVPPDSSMNVLGNKWVFHIKCNSDGSIKRYKARVVAKGYHQCYSHVQGDTLSPIVRQGTIRLGLSLALSHGWPIHRCSQRLSSWHSK